MTSPFLVYRMIHISNLEYILQQGRVVCPSHTNSDPGYTQIGNNDIIAARSRKAIPSFGTKTFRDSIGFYFGYPSIMLLNIKTGYGVPKIPQKEIIYLTFDISAIAKHGYEFFYTDGQANKIPTTRVFNNLSDIGEVDLEIAYTRNFSSKYTTMNPDLIRRKHAEFHIFGELDVSHLAEIVVFDSKQLNVVNKWVSKYDSKITARADNKYYY